MQKYMQKLANVSLAKLWGLISKPWRISVLLTAPSIIPNINAVLSLFPDLALSSVEACRLEFLRNSKFFEELNKKMVEKRHRRIICREWDDFLYMVVRFLKPQVVFETGVFDGKSSAIILQALNDNNDGLLISVDLPAVEAIKSSTNYMLEATLPPGSQPGWVIPDYLKKRHRLVLGDSKILLLQLFKEYAKVDIFFHDSLHTFEHQYFEYTTAWPYLSEGGILLSDDISWSPAFHRFCKKKSKNYKRLRGGFGAVRK